MNILKLAFSIMLDISINGFKKMFSLINERTWDLNRI